MYCVCVSVCVLPPVYICIEAQRRREELAVIVFLLKKKKKTGLCRASERGLDADRSYSGITKRKYPRSPLEKLN